VNQYSIFINARLAIVNVGIAISIREPTLWIVYRKRKASAFPFTKALCAYFAITARALQLYFYSSEIKTIGFENVVKSTYVVFSAYK
jgi:hypothetical protein